jgi:hypothetical protein
VASVALEDGETVVSVVQVHRRQPVTDEAYLLERVLALGDDLALGLDAASIDGDHPTESRGAVGQQVEPAVDGRDVLVVRRLRRAAGAPSQPSTPPVRSATKIRVSGSVPRETVSTRSRPSSDTWGSKLQSGPVGSRQAGLGGSVPTR